MPVQFLTRAERERLQSFPDEITFNELITFFTLSQKDLNLTKKRSGDHNLLGFALQLGTLRFLGFIPDNFPHLPSDVIEYVAQQLNISASVLSLYGERSQTRTNQLQEIQDYLGWSKPTATDYQKLAAWLLQRAMEHDRPLLLLQLLIKKLEISKVMRPGLTVLERMVATARNEAWIETYNCLKPILSPSSSLFLNQLLELDSESGRTPLSWLRTGAVSNSPKAIKNALAKLAFLNQHHVTEWDVSILNPNRLKFLAKLGRKSTPQALSRTPETRRYSILIAFCCHGYTEITDEVIDLYINTLAHIHARAKRERDEFQRRVAQSVNQKLKLFNKIGQVILDEDIKDEELRTRIYDQITPEELLASITECQSLVRSHGDDYYDFFALRYSYIRQFAPTFLISFHFHSHHQLNGLLEAIALLRNLEATRTRKVPETTSLAFVPSKWKNYVVNEERKIVRQIVNFQYHLTLSQIWGSGTLSSSDGQRFPVSVKNRMAVSLPRYFGYGQGVSFYSWTSDQFSQYGTKPTISTLRDSTYVLDEILDNETELSILEHTTDTSGYTELVFAMFDLLGLQFSPRIKDLGSQRLYRANRDSEYQQIESLLSGTIKTDKILARWDDMLRVTGSLKLGWVTASLFLNKLNSFPQQNDLASSFAEYGPMIKTIFILRYLMNQPYRRKINNQLNKGERLHDLRRFLFFAHQGAIRKRYEDDLSNQASCLNLVTNAVVTWNTLYMEAAIKQLRGEGYQISDEDISRLSPTRYRHINPYGKYQFDVETESKRTQLRPLRKPSGNQVK